MEVIEMVEVGRVHSRSKREGIMAREKYF